MSIPLASRTQCIVVAVLVVLPVVGLLRGGFDLQLYGLRQPVLHKVWQRGGQGNSGQTWPALHALPSPHGM